jgi:hypothetical protein
MIELFEAFLLVFEQALVPQAAAATAPGSW